MPTRWLQLFSTFESFERAWHGPSSAQRGLRELLSQGPHPDAVLREAAFYLGGAFERDGFSLFRNGGLPLLERSWGPWRQELILRPHPRPVRGDFVGARVEYHLSHADLHELRRRYWLPARLAPSVAASGLVDEVHPRPEYALWNLNCEPENWPELVRWIRERIGPLFDLLESPSQFERAALEHRLYGMGHRSIAELLMIEIGRPSATSYIQRLLDDDPLLRTAFYDAWQRTAAWPGIDPGETDAGDLALLVRAYDLNTARQRMTR